MAYVTTFSIFQHACKFWLCNRPVGLTDWSVYLKIRPTHRLMCHFYCVCMSQPLCSHMIMEILIWAKLYLDRRNNCTMERNPVFALRGCEGHRDELCFQSITRSLPPAVIISCSLDEDLMLKAGPGCKPNFCCLSSTLIKVMSCLSCLNWTKLN